MPSIAATLPESAPAQLTILLAKILPEEVLTANPPAWVSMLRTIVFCIVRAPVRTAAATNPWVACSGLALPSSGQKAPPTASSDTYGASAHYVVSVEDFDGNPMLPFDGGLSFDSPHLRFRERDKQAAGNANTEVCADFLADSGPQLGRFSQEWYDGGERAGPVLAICQEHVMRDLDVKTAGVGARSLGVEVEAVDDQNVNSLLGKEIGGRCTGEAAADDQHIGFHSPELLYPAPRPQILA